MRPPAGTGGAPRAAAGVHGLAVVADDLTGAADAAAPFARFGAEVAIVLDGSPPDGLQVLALVTDSRWRPSAEAARRVSEAVAQARRWGASQLLLKVDSTLRGHVRGDVAAALRAWPATAAVVTPAFPAQGRVVRDGVLRVHGQARGRVADAFPDGVVVADALDDDDLLALAGRVVSERAVAVGSAGLARALAQVLAERPAPPRRRPSSRPRGVVVVAGTPHPATRAQVHALRADGVVELAVAPGCRPRVGACAEVLGRRGRVLLTPAPGEDVAVDPDGPSGQALVAALAAAARDLLAASPGCGLVLTGGATALAVALALRAGSLRLLDETGPGVALGELWTADRVVPTITKSGGFGRPQELLHAVELLEELP